MKKILLSIILLASVKSSAQKTALLDVEFKKPIIYTDSVTVEQIKSGLFPVSTDNFDTLYANIQYLHSMLKKVQRSKMQSFELHSGSTKINISRIPFSNGDRYMSIAKSKIGEIETTLDLTPYDRSNAKNSYRLEKIMEYMKRNKDLFKAPYNVEPKIYNIVVVREH
jgi:hypothetical protein